MDNLVEKLSILLEQHALMLCCAESCTGGMLAMHITERAGSSRVFERGFVTYSNASKHETLGVSETTLRDHGAVSLQTATEMTQGALNHSRANIAISITGIAGPSGATQEKPIGLVFMAIASKDKKPQSFECHFTGSRRQIREHATQFALEQLITFITTEFTP